MFLSTLMYSPRLNRRTSVRGQLLGTSGAEFSSSASCRTVQNLATMCVDIGLSDQILRHTFKGSRGRPREAEELKDGVELLGSDGIVELVQVLHAVDGRSPPSRHEETAELVFGKTELAEQHEAVRMVCRLAEGIADAVLAVLLLAKDGAVGSFEELVLWEGGHSVYLSLKRGEGLVASYSRCQSVCPRYPWCMGRLFGFLLATRICFLFTGLLQAPQTGPIWM